MLSWTNPDYTKEPEHHTGHGMHRKCELGLLNIVATGMKGVVVIGCGHGEEFNAVLESDPKMICLGIDRLPNVDPKGRWSYLNRNLFPVFPIFNLDVVNELREWRASVPGNVLWYTDNGFKISELIAMSALCLPGDIIGTHDFSTEVPLDAVPFLSEHCGFTYLAEHDAYINRFFCLQGFWRKA